MDDTTPTPPSSPPAQDEGRAWFVASEDAWASAPPAPAAPVPAPPPVTPFAIDAPPAPWVPASATMTEAPPAPRVGGTSEETGLRSFDWSGPASRRTGASLDVSRPDWAFGSNKRGRLPAINAAPAIAVVVALISGTLGWIVLSKLAARPTRFALGFAPGQTVHYQAHLEMQATATAGPFSGHPTFSIDEAFTWRVESESADGTRTVLMTVDHVSAAMNGVSAHVPTPAPTVLRIASNGSMLSPTVIGFDPQGSGVPVPSPGVGQLFPLLPERPIALGDSWVSSFDQGDPFGKGSTTYTVTNGFLRYDTIDGRKTPVFTASFSVPVAMRFSLRDVAKAQGLSIRRLPARDRDGQIQIDGNVAESQTAWLDPVDHMWSKSIDDGRFTMTFRFPGGSLKMDGTTTMELVQVPAVAPVPHPSPSATAKHHRTSKKRHG